MLLSTGRAAAAASKPRYKPVAVETNFDSQDPQRAKRVQPILKKRAQEALQREHGVDASENADTKLVFYVLSLEEDVKSKGEEAVMDYGVRLEVRVDGEKVGDKIVPCVEKGEAELVDCAVEGIPGIVGYLPTKEAPAEDKPMGAPTPQSGDEPAGNGQAGSEHAGDARTKTEGPVSTNATDPVAPIGALGATGLAVASIGLGFAVAGGIYLGRGEVTADRAEAGFSLTTDYRPTGRPLLGAGIGLLVVGAAMVALDITVRSKKRNKHAHGHAHAARVALQLAPSFSGATLRGRF